MAVDYFTKWEEAETLANIRDVNVKKIVWKNIVTRFGVPDSLISDNRLQFDSRTFHKFCSNLGIKSRYSTPVYPRSNGHTFCAYTLKRLMNFWPSFMMVCVAVM